MVTTDMRIQRPITLEERQLVRLIWEAKRSMKYREVVSSNLSRIAYSRRLKVLIVTFRNDSSYMYEGVSRYRFEQLKKAESVGRYFNKFIKNKYPTTRLEDGDE